MCWQKAPVICGLLILASGCPGTTGTCLVAQDKATAKSVLVNAGLVNLAVKTMHAEGTLVATVTGPIQNANIESTIVYRVAPSRRLRIEIKEKGDDQPTVGIFDGITYWLFLPQRNAYMKSTGQAALSQYLSAVPFLGGNADPLMFTRDLRKAQILRTESVQLNGQNVDCYVVQASYNGNESYALVPGDKPLSVNITYWIQKATFWVVGYDADIKLRHLAVKGETENRQTYRFDKMLIDESMPDDLFVFVPPPGVKELTF